VGSVNRPPQAYFTTAAGKYKQKGLCCKERFPKEACKIFFIKEALDSHAIIEYMNHLANVNTNEGVRLLTFDMMRKPILIIPPSMLVKKVFDDENT
jgi:hypothetical protein